jgi:hypothetical protein
MTNEEMLERIKDLSRADLEKIALFAVGGLWGTGDGYDADKDVRGSDFIEHMGDVLDRVGLAPGEDPEDGE